MDRYTTVVPLCVVVGEARQSLAKNGINRNEEEKWMTYILAKRKAAGDARVLGTQLPQVSDRVMVTAAMQAGTRDAENMW